MLTVSSIDGEEIARKFSRGRKTVHILDSEISFFHKPADEALWVNAKTSDKLQHPFLENWIGEPLRILLGQLMFPRLVARNFGDGTAQVSLRRSPAPPARPGIASLVGSAHVKEAEFWKLYAGLLTVIAEDNDPKQPSLEPHPITRFYEEIAQSARGSRWVLCMTLASAAEGIANMLPRPAEQMPPFSETEVDELKKTIQAWRGNDELRERVLGWFSFLGQTSVKAHLRQLREQGAITKDNEDAWNKVRNAVMHGTLVVPWATKRDDERIHALADLVHRLTRELIRKHYQTSDRTL
jgi:DNA-binding transcriptional ArsR family regulator